jgi:hypothetical protein
MQVIPVNKVVDPKRIIGKRRVEEEERHKGSLTPPLPPPKKNNMKAVPDLESIAGEETEVLAAVLRL